LRAEHHTPLQAIFKSVPPGYWKTKVGAGACRSDPVRLSESENCLVSNLNGPGETNHRNPARAWGCIGDMQPCFATCKL
jgi:hypothetical protein